MLSRAALVELKYLSGDSTQWRLDRSPRVRTFTYAWLQGLVWDDTSEKKKRSKQCNQNQKVCFSIPWFKSSLNLENGFRSSKLVSTCKAPWWSSIRRVLKDLIWTASQKTPLFWPGPDTHQLYFSKIQAKVAQSIFCMILSLCVKTVQSLVSIRSQWENTNFT